MKYIVDTDSLQNCIDLLPIPYCVNGTNMIRLDDAKEMIEKFPKDEYVENSDRKMSYWLPFTAEDGTKYKTCGNCNHDILDGEVDYYCPKCGCAMDPRTTLGN